MNTIAMFGLTALVLSAAPAGETHGKPQAPVNVETSLAGTIEPDRDLPVTITLTPAKHCSQLTTVVRGIDGIVVTGGGTVRHACAKNKPVAHAASIRAPAGVAGSLVVDVTMVVRGKKITSSQAFPIAAPNAEPKQETLGRRVIGPDGKPQILMEAQPER